MNICVIGSGYVGLVSGACFADFGLNVVCVDKDPAVVEMLGKGEIPIYEPGLKEVVDKNAREGRLSFSTDVSGSIRESLVVFIAVGTPQGEDGSVDLSHVDEVAKTIGENLNAYKVVVTKSTVSVGTGKRIRKIIEEASGGAQDFDVASNPEFLREGSAVEDFMRPDRVVIGSDSKRAIEILKELYSPLYLIETPLVITGLETAELIKYAANAFLATKISFINEIANLCEIVGGDVRDVAKAMGLDKRIGSKFLHPGPGYGGSCFPKDTHAIVRSAAEHGYDFKIAAAVTEVNEAQWNLMVEKIKKALGGTVKGKVICALGLTFKPNTDDVRESAAIKIINALIKEGAKVRAFDPVGMEKAKSSIVGEITFCKDSYDAAHGADCLVILTEWNQFRKLDLDKLKQVLGSNVIVDCKNIYDPVSMRSRGFEFYCVGRQSGL